MHSPTASLVPRPRPLNDIGPLKRELAMIKRMIIGQANSATASFFTRKYDAVRSSRDAYATIKRSTGHKSRPPFSGSLFLNGDKTECLGGAPAITEALAKQFDRIHRLTHGDHSVYEDEYGDAVGALDLRIHFGGPISARIDSFDMLSTVNDRSPPPSDSVVCSPASGRWKG